MTRMICGLQPVREAIRAQGPALARVLISAGPDATHLEALARFATDHGVNVERTSRAELDRMTKNAHHQGAVALAPELKLTKLEELSLSSGALVIVLDELEDPQNFGAIIRSAVALGSTAVMWPEHRSAPLSAATFRASAGAVEHATLCRVSSLVPAIETMAADGVTVVGLDTNADLRIDEVNLTGPLALVVGAEGKGLRKTVKRACGVLAHLPMNGPIASLNASVAVAIAIYEVGRQRRAASASSSPSSPPPFTSPTSAK